MIGSKPKLIAGSVLSVLALFFALAQFFNANGVFPKKEAQGNPFGTGEFTNFDVTIPDKTDQQLIDYINNIQSEYKSDLFRDITR